MVNRAMLAKLLVAVLAIWFFAGLLLLVMPNPHLAPCREKCSAEGFDTVLSASAEECYCRSSISRARKVIENT